MNATVMTPEQLLADRAICEAATPGPWYAEQVAAGFTSIRTETDKKLVFALAHPNPKCGDPEMSIEEKYANLALFASARTRWPAALDEIERLRAVIEDLPHDQDCDYIQSIMQRDEHGRRVPPSDCNCFKSHIEVKA